MKRPLKRTLSLALAVLMTVLVIPFSTLLVSAESGTAPSASPSTGRVLTDNDLSGTEPEGEGTYYINSTSDWYKVRSASHDRSPQWTWKNKTVVLNADLDFGANESWRLFYEFEGTFDGNGHTIKNTTTKGFQFLVFNLKDGAVIKNVTFKDITHTYGRDNTTYGEGGNGLIAGDVAADASVTFESVCVDTCTVSATGDMTWNYGFLLGRVQSKGSLTIKNCVIKNSKVGADSNRIGLAVGKMNGNCSVNGLQVLDCEFTKGNGWASYGTFGEVCENCTLTASNVYMSGITHASGTMSNAMLVGSCDTGVGVVVKNSVFSSNGLTVIATTGRIPSVKFDTCIFDMNDSSVLNSVGKNNNLVEVITNNCVTTSDNLKQINALTQGTTITLNEGMSKTADDSILKVSKERAAEMFTRNDKGFITKVDGHISVNYAQDTTGGTAVAVGETYSIRFIAVSQVAAPKNAGITVVARIHGTSTQHTYDTLECDTYDKLIGYDGIDEFNYQASEFNAEKFMAVIIAGIPAGTAYDFVITPHYETEGGITVTGETVTVTYGADGLLVTE